MPMVTFIDSEKTEHQIDVLNGDSLMQASLDNGLPSIMGDCGGACACATCHVYIDESWYEKVGAPSEAEVDMLAGVLDPGPTSRLSCQIFMNDELEGLVVHLPESQF